MTHTIIKSKHRITTPTGLYEANYRRFIRLVPELHNLAVNDEYELSLPKIIVNVIAQYKYTTVLTLKQHLQTNLKLSTAQKLTSINHLIAIDMELRVCYDACLVEVIGYQGKTPIQSIDVYPNAQMLQVDEKRQLNLFLRDVLENALKTEYCHHSNETIGE